MDETMLAEYLSKIVAPRLPEAVFQKARLAGVIDAIERVLLDNPNLGALARRLAGDPDGKMDAVTIADLSQAVCDLLAPSAVAAWPELTDVNLPPPRSPVRTGRGNQKFNEFMEFAEIAPVLMGAVEIVRWTKVDRRLWRIYRHELRRRLGPGALPPSGRYQPSDVLDILRLEAVQQAFREDCIEWHSQVLGTPMSFAEAKKHRQRRRNIAAFWRVGAFRHVADAIETHLARNGGEIVHIKDDAAGESYMRLRSMLDFMLGFKKHLAKI